ncbi:MAG: membrane-bound O-acyltransferase family protein [Crocinitomicaceae bacterium]|nr:membrane-bound O-acyltransferase family protein [Crocinitomicaceae bacterium]|tara:strand:- start:19083 stop:20807 length:1725 start_codon:yes stop_codon:yes gene_type:complete
MERLFSIFSSEIGDGSSLVFTKLDFWLFFLLVMIVLSFLNKKTIVRSIFLTIVSLFFFYKTSGLYMLLLIISVTFNYFLGRRIFISKNEINRKFIIIISAIFNLFILGYFKYAYFFTASFNDMFHSNYEIINQFAKFGNSFFDNTPFVEKILLPVGVSFFTFQNISYVVDIYRKEINPVKNFFHYSFFVTFFPQLVMGPIVRARDFMPQLAQQSILTKVDFSWSIIQIVKGLIKKIVIADFLIVYFIDKLLFTETFTFEEPGFVYVIVMWAYSIHIYADFSGYTDIAIGLSRLMGFKLKPNFNSPYKAVNVADFWRRWHISLGSWLKDYLYIPLGGNRTGGIGSYIAIALIFTFLIFITQWWELLWIYGGLTIIYLLGIIFITDFKRFVHRDLNLIITMVLGGLWHGPSENFVIWGAMNGCALLVYKYWKRISFYENSQRIIAHFWKIFITFNFITFTRIWFKLDEARIGPFKESGLTDYKADKLPMELLNQITFHFNFSIDYFIKFIDTYHIPLIIMLAGFIVHWLPNKVKTFYEKTFTSLPMWLQIISVSIIILLVYQAIGLEQPPFVYLQF